MCLFNGYSPKFRFLPLWHLHKIRKPLQIIMYKVVKRQSPEVQGRKVAGANRIEEWGKKHSFMW